MHYNWSNPTKEPPEDDTYVFIQDEIFHSNSSYVAIYKKGIFHCIDGTSIEANKVKRWRLFTNPIVEYHKVKTITGSILTLAIWFIILLVGILAVKSIHQTRHDRLSEITTEIKECERKRRVKCGIEIKPLTDKEPHRFKPNGLVIY